MSIRNTSTDYPVGRDLPGQIDMHRGIANNFPQILEFIVREVEQVPSHVRAINHKFRYCILL